MPDKGKIQTHIEQLFSMAKYYPEAQPTLEILLNHLNNLRKIKSNRPSRKFNDFSELAQLQESKTIEA